MRIEYQKLAIGNFISNPLGKGVVDIQVNYKGRTSSIHNQFLTFIVSGGLIALFGLIVLAIGLIKVFGQIFQYQKEQKDQWSRYLFAATMACMTFFITLLFIEMSGLLLFVMISILLFLEKEILILDKGYEKGSWDGNQ